MATYALTESPTMILRVDDWAYIPTDPANTDYQTYLAWLDKGNQPRPNANAQTPVYEPPTPNPAPRLTGQPEKRR